MRRSNRHHPSSAAADAYSSGSSPAQKSARSGPSKRTTEAKAPTRLQTEAKAPTRLQTEAKAPTRLQTEAKAPNRTSGSHRQQSAPEPRKQRAAAMVAKDAMILMTNNAVVKDLIKPSTASKKDHTTTRKRVSNARAGSPSSSKQLRSAKEAKPTPAPSTPLEAPPEEQAEPSAQEPTQPLPPHLSAFPRELTVKEVIAKSMRANRVSMRGLSRDIVGIMKSMQSKEKANQDSGCSSSRQSAGSSQGQETETATDAAKPGSNRPSLVVSLDAILTGNTQMSEKLTASQDHMTVQEVVSPSVLEQRQSSQRGECSALQAVLVTCNRADERSVQDNQADHITDLTCDEEMTAEVSQPNRELSVSEKVLVIADFDAGMLPHELGHKYSVSKMQIAEVLSNRIPIIRQQTASLSDRVALKRRRTNFVGLNIMMWRFFSDCRGQGIVLNGRQLKEHALTIAKQLGLHNFKGSEGWLDSFKRRHSIDLKTMTGHPVIYETDNDGNVFCPGENPPESYSPDSEPPGREESMIVDTNQFLIDAADAAARAIANAALSPNNLNTLASAACGSTDMGPCQATAAVRTTQPLDLAMLPSTSIASHNTCCGTSLRGSSANEVTMPTIQALIESCCCRIDEPQVAHAMDTLRSYIMANDVVLLPQLVSLQKELSNIAARRSRHASLPAALTVPLPAPRQNPAADHRQCASRENGGRPPPHLVATPSNSVDSKRNLRLF